MGKNSKEYSRTYMARRRKERRERLLEMSGKICARCGSEENLEFNHLDRKAMLFRLSLDGMGKNWDLILAEWRKCELLCHDCHRIYTQEQYRNGEIPIWNSLKHVPYVCGTPRCYHEKACRCESCKAAGRAYKKKEIDYHSPVAQ